MRIHKTIMSLGLSVLMAVSQISFGQSLSVTAASENAQTKRVMVSLGDSYSSGEGIDPFYGQDVAIPKLAEIKDEETSDQDVLDWLAHRSKGCWSGMLELPGVSGPMSEHRDENWYFVAASGAEIKNLGVPVTYLEQVEEILNRKSEAESHVSKDDVTKSRDFLRNLTSSSQIETLKNKWSMERQSKDYYQTYYDVSGEGDEISAEFHNEPEIFDGTCYLPYQLDVFDQIGDNSVDYVTMTLSGNDVGFTQIVEKAVPESFFRRVEKLQEVSQRNTHRNNNLQYQIDPLGSTPNSAIAPNDLTNLLNSKLQLFDAEVGYRLMAAYIAVQERAGSNAKIIVAGYPKLLNEEGSALFSAEASKQIDNCACILNTKIKNIVDDSRIYGGLNIYFVPVADGFSGREAGTSDPYINYVEFKHSNDIDQKAPVSAYSIHPNEKGAAAYADAVQDKIDELEGNGIISGVIYEERPDTPVSDIASRIEKITAVNYDTGYKKSVYVDPAENTTFGKWRVSGDVGLIRNDSTGDDEGFSKLETKNLLYYSEDQISSTGHYEMVLPPGNYQLEVTCCDGTQFTLMDPNDPEQSEVVEVKARDVIKTQNIYLTEQEFGEPGSSYSWALEPSVEAEDIYVVDTDEAYLDQDRIDKACVGFGMESKYSAYDSAAYRIGGTVGLIDYSGNILVTNEKHNVFTVQNGTIDVDYFWQFGWPGSPWCFYDYDESTGKITDEWNVPYNGTDTILVGKHDDQWNWKYGLYKNDTFLTSIDFENGKMNFASNNGVFALYKNDKWGYFDKDGNQIIDFVCDSVGCVPDGMLGLCVTGYGTDETGTDISESDSIHEHNDIYMATDGYIPVRIDGQWALYDVSGTQVIPTDVFAEIRPVHNGLAWVKDKETGLWGVIQLEESGDTNTNPDKQDDDSGEENTSNNNNDNNINWKELYYNTLKNDFSDLLSTPYAHFDIADLNNDGITELLVSAGESHFQCVKIYTVYDGEACYVGEIGNYGTIRYNSEKNCILTGFIHMGYEYFEVYKIDEGKLIDITGGKNDTYSKDAPPYIYQIDGEDVTEEEYDRVCCEYGYYGDDENVIYYGTTYEFTQESIDEVLSTGKPVSESEGITPEEAEFIGSWKCKAYYADGENVTDEVIEYFNEDYEEKCSISEMIEIEINDDHTAVVYVGNRSENHECSWRMSKNTLVLFDDEDPDETIILEKMNGSATTIKVTWDEDEEYALFEKS